MSSSFVSRGFKGRRREGIDQSRLPTGQYLTDDFPVLSAGPTPRTALSLWSFEIRGLARQPRRWTWEQFQALPHEQIKKDIHCVTKWSKLDTQWSGVSLDFLLGEAEPQAKYVMAFCDGGYTTNLPIEDVTGGRAWIVDKYAGAPLSPEQGQPARLLVPHLYFWKSAKWVRGLELIPENRPGFWESLGYHLYGDPWKEQRYSGD
jgi:DMSO/TMAO reductase YedYZ molybdopterin-dependent catalytic subunit